MVNLWQRIQEYTIKIVSLINVVEKTGQSHAKEWNWITILHYIQKLPWDKLKTYI